MRSYIADNINDTQNSLCWVYNYKKGKKQKSKLRFIILQSSMGYLCAEVSPKQYKPLPFNNFKTKWYKFKED